MAPSAKCPVHLGASCQAFPHISFGTNSGTEQGADPAVVFHVKKRKDSTDVQFFFRLESIAKRMAGNLDRVIPNHKQTNWNVLSGVGWPLKPAYRC